MERSGRKHRFCFNKCLDVKNADKRTFVFSHKVKRVPNSYELIFMESFANAAKNNSFPLGAYGSPANLSLNSCCYNINVMKCARKLCING